MPWKFVPLQKEMTITPGKPALAFYNAENLTNEHIIGVATYNITPQKVHKRNDLIHKLFRQAPILQRYNAFALMNSDLDQASH